MSTLANLAARFPRRVKKQDAQAILKSLADQHPESLADLARLYSYFMPPAPKVAKTPFEWAAQAIGKDDCRPYLNYVHVCNTYITGTDGHRLHRVGNDQGLAPGYYLANGDKAFGPEAYKYPEVERIIPSPANPARQNVYMRLEDLVINDDKSGKYQYYIIPIPGDDTTVHVQRKYLEQAMYGLKEAWINIGGPTDTVLVDDGSTTAVVMPMRKK